MGRIPAFENIVWHTLTGPHARFAQGQGPVRRYARGFSPILAFEDQANPVFEALSECCDIGESFYCEGWTGAVAPNWTIEVDSLMVKMVFDGGVSQRHGSLEMVELQESHAEQAVELARLTNPGPFGMRTMELGDYVGFLDGDRLTSMAGERFFAGKYREVSGVCTHPDYQGRGFARQLMVEMMRRQVDRGEIPFLHVMSSNNVARTLYESIGFKIYHETAVRVIKRIG